jgi:hypothetical protein
MARASNQHPDTISSEPPAIANRFGSLRWRSAGYHRPVLGAPTPQPLHLD